MIPKNTSFSRDHPITTEPPINDEVNTSQLESHSSSASAIGNIEGILLSDLTLTHSTHSAAKRPRNVAESDDDDDWHSVSSVSVENPDDENPDDKNPTPFQLEISTSKPQTEANSPQLSSTSEQKEQPFETLENSKNSKNSDTFDVFSGFLENPDITKKTEHRNSFIIEEPIKESTNLLHEEKDNSRSSTPNSIQIEEISLKEEEPLKGESSESSSLPEADFYTALTSKQKNELEQRKVVIIETATDPASLPTEFIKKKDPSKSIFRFVSSATKPDLRPTLQAYCLTEVPCNKILDTLWNPEKISKLYPVFTETSCTSSTFSETSKSEVMEYTIHIPLFEIPFLGETSINDTIILSKNASKLENGGEILAFQQMNESHYFNTIKGSLQAVPHKDETLIRFECFFDLKNYSGVVTNHLIKNKLGEITNAIRDWSQYYRNDPPLLSFPEK